MQPPADPRAVAAGSLIRAYANALRARGLFEKVSAVVSPPTRALLDHPPLPSSWLDGRALVELLEATNTLGGIEAVRELGYEATRTDTSKLLGPILRGVIALSGPDPAALFAGWESCAEVLFRGLALSYAPLTPRSGAITFRSKYRLNAVAYAAWEGSLRICYDACSIQGVIAPTVIAPDGRSGTMAVSW